MTIKPVPYGQLFVTGQRGYVKICLCTSTLKTWDNNCGVLFLTRYKIQDGFIAFSSIQLYTYKTLFTYRHAQYLSSLRDMIQVQGIFSYRHCQIFKIITKCDKPASVHTQKWCICYFGVNLWCSILNMHNLQVQYLLMFMLNVILRNCRSLRTLLECNIVAII